VSLSLVQRLSDAAGQADLSGDADLAALLREAGGELIATAADAWDDGYDAGESWNDGIGEYIPKDSNPNRNPKASTA